LGFSSEAPAGSRRLHLLDLVIEGTKAALGNGRLVKG